MAIDVSVLAGVVGLREITIVADTTIGDASLALGDLPQAWAAYTRALEAAARLPRGADCLCQSLKSEQPPARYDRV